jgi:hypothetical protein
MTSALKPLGMASHPFTTGLPAAQAAFTPFAIRVPFPSHFAWDGRR